MVFGAIFDGAKKLVGRAINKDELEAVVAAGVLMANASGGIDPKERDQLLSSLTGNEALKDFDAGSIRAIMNRFVETIEAGPRSGKLALKKEITDVAKSPAIAERVFMVALDVADHGGIDDAEKAVAIEIASWLNLNAADYL